MKKYNLPVVKTIFVEPKNRIWICDVSGSMYGNIAAMTDDIVEQLNACDPMDLLTILWFSSEGMFGTIVKGVRIGGDKQRIADTIRRQMYARNLTCFSDSLSEAVKAIDDLQHYNMPYSLMFFSDGYPVVSNLNIERSKIFANLFALRNKISDCVIIGYGDYYNRELLSQMAETIGGVFVHADDIQKFSYTMRDHIKSASAPRHKLNVDCNASYFAIDPSDKVVLFKSNGDGELLVALNYRTVYELPNGMKKSDYDEDEHLLYAAATAYAKVGKIDAALDVLSAIGDVFLVNKLASAFTNSEIGLAIQEVEAAVSDSNLRFLNGKQRNCLPKRDAFCLIQALEILQKDKDARFHPDKGFEYKLTGVPTKLADGYPEFQRVKNHAVPIELTWHESRLNVSLRVEYAGHVVLGDDIVNYGYSNPFSVTEFRNYVIIKDGVLNVKKLPVSMSYETFMAFVGGKLIKQSEVYDKNRVYILDLTRIPIMNRAMADGVKAIELAELAIKELDLEAELKVAKYFRNQLDPDKEFVESQFSQEFIAYLKRYGIDHKAWYAPKYDKQEPTDWYDAKRFEIKIKGASSLPKIDEVIAREKSGKLLNLAQSTILKHYLNYENTARRYGVAGIDDAIRIAKENLANIRTKINRARCAIILGNRWPEDLGSKDNNTILFNFTEVKFDLTTERIAY